MHSTRVMITLAAFLMALGASVAAQDGTSNTILFQTRVETPEGDPIPNGNYPVRFSIYATESDTNTLWTETQPLVEVTDGLSNTIIFGETPPPSNLFDQWDSLWLEVAIDRDNDGFDAGDVFNPRTPLHAVPFALYAKDAASLGGSPAEDYAKKDEVYTRAEAEGQFANAGIVDSFNDFKDEYNEVIVTKADQATVTSALESKADASAVIQWQLVSSGPVTLQRNWGYIADSTSELTLNMPASGSLSVGDVVRVAGKGAGGWRILQAAGQFVRTETLGVANPLLEWFVQESPRDWKDLASSADGSKLVAVDANVPAGGRIYTSVDFGATWTPRESDRLWNTVTSSADGTKLAATVFGGQIYTSTDSGETWSARDSNRDWISVASSSDGVKLIAAVTDGNLYTSTDSGVTWIPRENIRQWSSVASSADGAKLAATVYGNGQIYISNDSGMTWNPRAGLSDWLKIVSSADGSRLLASVDSGQLWVSTDSGFSWLPTAFAAFWSDIASSADGATLLAASYGQIFRSTDGGLTWGPLETSRLWVAVASSADGKKLAAAVQGGHIYTYTPVVERSTEGETGGLKGGPNTAVELLYVGNGEFLPLNSSGSIGIF